MYKGKLVFATNNPNKLKEAKHILPAEISILSLKEIGCFDELPETHFTIEENADEKAAYVFEKFSINCFAEDTGLEVEALNGAPGVFSARYAGEPSDNIANIRLLLQNLKGAENRKAQFRTIVSLILDGKYFRFEGKINGIITSAPRGTEGFGYDSIFQPVGYSATFAELGLDEKSTISHRSMAMKSLFKFLTES